MTLTFYINFESFLRIQFISVLQVKGYSLEKISLNLNTPNMAAAEQKNGFPQLKYTNKIYFTKFIFISVFKLEYLDSSNCHHASINDLCIIG